ncbi:hypothetical protein [Ornithinibacillus californiensis]|uniref:hypothetical protein n=1 Tax=Ornithinibacillus californiensis TaxID=161536 RepID=UPI00064D8E43|nr:hypothetical protein [Ornithinibacillus californiensis]
MKKLVLLLTGVVLMMVLVACSSPEADEVLEYHNAMADTINPKLDQIPTMYNEITSAATDEEAIEIFDKKLIPLIGEIKEFYDSQSVEYNVTKEYHNLNVELVNAMNDVVLKEKEYFEAFLDPNATEEDILALEAEMDELNAIAEEKDAAVTERWEALVEEYAFEEIEE